MSALPAHAIHTVARALALAAALSAAAVFGAGCWRDVRLLPGDGGGADRSGAGEAPPGGDAGAGGNGDAGAIAACTGLGDPIRLPTAAGLTCASALETRGHRYVLCSCEAMTASARVRTDAFDSRDPLVQDDVAAAIGIGGALVSSAEVRAGGALTVAGAGGVRASEHVQTSTSLRVGGPLAMLSQNADVGGDAFVAGDVSGEVRVRGALHVPAAAAVSAATEATSVTREAVAVASPCDCSAGFADVAVAIGLAAATAAASPDAAAGLAPGALAAVTAPVRLDVPCGTSFLTAVDTGAAVTLAVHGRALLAVAGDVVLRGPLTVELDPSAELDLLVGGRLTASGGGTLGAPAAPARVRIWIAGTSSIVLDDQPTVGAVIHAPQAALSAPGGLTLYGSLLSRSVALGADSMLHFDRAILAAGTACGEPAADVVP